MKTPEELLCEIKKEEIKKQEAEIKEILARTRKDYLRKRDEYHEIEQKFMAMKNCEPSEFLEKFKDERYLSVRCTYDPEGGIMVRGSLKTTFDDITV